MIAKMVKNARKKYLLIFIQWHPLNKCLQIKMLAKMNKSDENETKISMLNL